eukprot:PhM_4_TR10838/c0_g1_i1/m.63300
MKQHVQRCVQLLLCLLILTIHSTKAASTNSTSTSYSLSVAMTTSVSISPTMTAAPAALGPTLQPPPPPPSATPATTTTTDAPISTQKTTSTLIQFVPTAQEVADPNIPDWIVFAMFSGIIVGCVIIAVAFVLYHDTITEKAYGVGAVVKGRDRGGWRGSLHESLLRREV